MGGLDIDLKDMNSTEILNVGDMTWSFGPNLPIGVNQNAGVESVDDSYLGFSVGGHRNHYGVFKEIYGLQNTKENVLKWVKFGEMDENRHSHTVANVPWLLLPSYQ